MKTVIIIPYRDRLFHLKYYIENSYPKLKEKIPELEVIIVEQVEGNNFNRGLMINIGFDHYNNDDNYYITQDVDINPICEESINFYETNVETDDFQGIYCNPYTLGGIIKFKGSTFKKINGFANDFWGWGHEDKDLQNRAEYFNCNIHKIITKSMNKKYINELFKIFEDNQNRKDCGKWSLSYKIFKDASDAWKNNYIKNNGLSTLNYKIIHEMELMPGVKKIIVSPDSKKNKQF